VAVARAGGFKSFNEHGTGAVGDFVAGLRAFGASVRKPSDTPLVCGRDAHSTWSALVSFEIIISSLVMNLLSNYEPEIDNA
jgi:hypothetical protein